MAPSTTTVLPATPVPTLNGTPAVPQNYDANRPGPSYQELKPIPQSSSTHGAGNSGSHPLLCDPHSRTTSLPPAPRVQAERSLVTPAVYVAPAKNEATLDDGGWRAARR